jgi:transcriptional regulator with XRE-family HTH domain
MAASARDRSKAPEAVLFGQILRRKRQERQWSQAQLAEAAGVTLNYIGNLERGEQGPSLHILIRLAMALEMDLPALLADFGRATMRRLGLH